MTAIGLLIFLAATVVIVVQLAMWRDLVRWLDALGEMVDDALQRKETPISDRLTVSVNQSKRKENER
jgi:hypothetical protein